LKVTNDMLYFARWKILAILLTVLAGFVVALPNFLTSEQLKSWPSFLPKWQMPLGLDLRGGAHMLLAMDTKELTTDWLTTVRDDSRKQLREAKIGFSAVGLQGDEVKITLVKPEDAENAVKELRKLIQPLGNPLFGTSGEDLTVSDAGGGNIILKPTAAGLTQRISNATGAAIETINRRVNGLGVAESTVIRQGADRILIQFPGLQDTSQLKAIIGQTAKLTFHAVHPTVTAEEAKTTRVPLGYKIYPSAEDANQAYVLQDSAVVSGEDLVDASQSFDSQTNEPVIAFRFNLSGARKFGKFTTENIGSPFAILLDNKVLSAPVIQTAIPSGSGQISGRFTVETANNLAIQLRSGSLPAKLTIVEERTVGPSLGADSIEAGKKAGWIGGIATVLLTVLAYGTFGVYAVIGLLVHAILILALMTLIGTTLTLPGIAGFILTIAMAVDANVLIYERIREELRAGKTAIAAIDAGFSRAIVTIIDSQLTTLAAAVIMFWLGSGPIRGFAVTLALGIVTSVFAAVTITRLLVAMWLKNAKTKGRSLQVPV
jgi:protein-export membrane protein SecD